MQNDEASSVRMISAKALGRIKDPDAVEILMYATIEDPAAGVRQESVIALGEIGDKEAIPTAIEALKDDYKDVQLAAAGALTKLTGEDFGRNYEEWTEWQKKQ